MNDMNIIMLIIIDLIFLFKGNDSFYKVYIIEFGSLKKEILFLIKIFLEFKYILISLYLNNYFIYRRTFNKYYYIYIYISL